MYRSCSQRTLAKPVSASACFDKPQLFCRSYRSHAFFVDRSTLNPQLRNQIIPAVAQRRRSLAQKKRGRQKTGGGQKCLKCKKSLLRCSQGSRIWRTGAAEGYERTAVTLRVHSIHLTRLWKHAERSGAMIIAFKDWGREKRGAQIKDTHQRAH